jgi:hypothetical protein
VGKLNRQEISSAPSSRMPAQAAVGSSTHLMYDLFQDIYRKVQQSQGAFPSPLFPFERLRGHFARRMLLWESHTGLRETVQADGRIFGSGQRLQVVVYGRCGTVQVIVEEGWRGGARRVGLRERGRVHADSVHARLTGRVDA